MYCANANEKKAGVGESDTTEQLRMSTATTKSKKMETLKPNHHNLQSPSLKHLVGLFGLFLHQTKHFYSLYDLIYQ